MFVKLRYFFTVTCLLLSLFCFCSFAEGPEETANYVLNGNFEDMDGSPDYSPNDWNVKKGWFTEAMPGKAADGEGYMVAVQGAEASQNISDLPAGKYTLSAYIAPLFNADHITLRLTSGNKEAEITVTYEDMCDYYEINGFEISDGKAVITLLYSAKEECDFNSTAIVDDIVLSLEPEPTPTSAPTPTSVKTEDPTEAPTAYSVITEKPAEQNDSNEESIVPVIIIAAAVTAVIIAVVFLIKGKRK